MKLNRNFLIAGLIALVSQPNLSLGQAAHPAQPAVAGVVLNTQSGTRPPPPPLKAETKPPEPKGYKHAKWIDGRWRWNGFNYVWVPGRWR